MNMKGKIHGGSVLGECLGAWVLGLHTKSEEILPVHLEEQKPGEEQEFWVNPSRRKSLK